MLSMKMSFRSCPRLLCILNCGTSRLIKGPSLCRPFQSIYVSSSNFHIGCSSKVSTRLNFSTKYFHLRRLYSIEKDIPDGNHSQENNEGTEIKVVPRMKKKQESVLTRERNFITPLRAMTEFLLQPKDIEVLRKTKRRSPYENEPPITVLWRKDVEETALKIWGSAERIEKERKERANQITLSQNRKHDKNYKKFANFAFKTRQSKTDVTSSSKVVWAAVIVNGMNFLMKLGAWMYTGSHSLFAEALHSFADVTNQLILAYGIHKSQQQADSEHPYGFTSMQYVSSLISGAMIFCIGSGLSMQHGIMGLLHPTEVVSAYHGLFALGSSFVLESITLVMAMKATIKGARECQMPIKDYVWQKNDPSVNVVLLEDMAAVVGVVVALSCMGLTSVLGSHIPDALGSCAIGGILAGVSGVIIYTNTNALIGRSIRQKDLNLMNTELESDVMIRAVHDVKGIDMGSGLVRYKAEVDFDGRELTKQYLQRQDLEEMLKQMRSLNTPEELEKEFLKHGERIVECLGAEVDRIEKDLKKKHPEIRHCDLEVL